MVQVLDLVITVGPVMGQVRFSDAGVMQAGQPRVCSRQIQPSRVSDNLRGIRCDNRGTASDYR